MRKYEFHAEQWLPVSIDKAYDFFSSPSNLTTITPPDLDFVILTEGLAPEIYTGMKIRYYVKPLLGVRVKWETEITDVQKPFSGPKPFGVHHEASEALVSDKKHFGSSRRQRWFDSDGIGGDQQEVPM